MYKRQLRGVETLTGSAGADQVTFGDTGNLTLVTAVEVLRGGTGIDIVLLGTATNAASVADIEFLVGNAGVDVVTLGAPGVVTMRGVDTLLGSGGTDIVVLGNTTNAMTIAGGVEYLVGGTGIDTITLAGSNTVLTLRGIETLAGTAAADLVTLGNTGNTMAMAGIETLIGGTAADLVTVTAGTTRFEGGVGADAITLSSAPGADQIVFGTTDDGGALAVDGGYNTVGNFEPGTDRLVLSGSLRGLIDRNGDSVLTSSQRDRGTIDGTIDEVVRLTTPSVALTGSDFADVRTAIGAITNPAGATILVTASNGPDVGAYLVTDTDRDGAVAAGEIRLLALFRSVTALAAGDVQLG